MTAAIKDNEAIWSDQAAFMQALGRAREVLGKIDGVVGVAFGHKHTGGRFTDDVSIQVFVMEKRPEAELPPEQRIPPTFEGYRTDVRRVPRVKPASNTTKYATLQGGVCIIPYGPRAPAAPLYDGTLGCIVRKRGDRKPEDVYLLSCEHVLFANNAGDGDAVYHPTPPKPANAPTQLVAKVAAPGFNTVVEAYVPVDPQTSIFASYKERFFVDCALAKVETASTCCSIVCSGNAVVPDSAVIDRHRQTPATAVPGDTAQTANQIKGVRSIWNDLSMVFDKSRPIGGVPSVFPRVFKVGIASGKTQGVCRSVGMPVVEDDPAHPPIVLRPNIIEIEFVPSPYAVLPQNENGNKAFGEHGDSGSVVLDQNDNVVAMLYAIPDNLPPGTREWLTYACHIYPILQKLDVLVVTAAGNTAGTCKMDGSVATNLDLARLAELPMDPDQRLFAAGWVPGRVAAVPPRATDNAPDRTAEVAAALQASVEGRALHAAFSAAWGEIGFLVRNNRAVKIAWHRHHGPAFLAHMLNHLRGQRADVPRHIEGITREALLARMGEVLTAHGSPLLRDALQRHGAALRALLTEADTADDLLAALRARDPETAPLQ